MTRPSPNPTIADLYLAFRQAKTALYFEKRGVGLLELAEYEQTLPENLRALKAKIANRKWFDRIDIGETWIVPSDSAQRTRRTTASFELALPSKPRRGGPSTSSFD